MTASIGLRMGAERPAQIGQHLCAVMTKTINQEDINFAAVIESNEERDNSFNFLDTLSVFFEKEAKNSKMTTEMNDFLSKNIKQQMVDFVVIEERANARLGSKEKLTNMQNSLSKTTQIAQNSISRRRSSSRSDGQ